MSESVNLLEVGLGVEGFRKLFISLPEGLRLEFKRVVKQKMSLAHAWMMLIVARRMLDEGMREVHFHHELQLADEKITVDVYGCSGERRYYAECVTSPEENSVYKRARSIKDQDPAGEFILAIQDRVGYAIAEMGGEIDYIWVACKDGRALNLDDWMGMRLERLNMAAGGFASLRRLIDELSELTIEAGRSEAAAKTHGWNALLQIKNSLSTALDRIAALEEMDVSFSVNSSLLKRLQEVKEEALRRIIAVASETLSLTWPLRLTYENGKLRVEGGTSEDFYWHNWPANNMQPAQEKILKDLKRTATTESKIVLAMIMPDLKGEYLRSIAPIMVTPLRQEMAQLALYLTGKMEEKLEKIMEAIT